MTEDGDLDLVFVGEDDQVVGYHLNDGAAGFIDVSDRLPNRATSNTVVATDVDGDGDADLVVANAGPDFIWINDGAGRFTDESQARLPQHDDVSQDIAVGDIDGNGNIDLVFGNEEQNRLYLNDGAGFFTEATLPRRATPEETRDVHLVDIDADGDLDLYFANVRIFNADRDQQDRLLLNDGAARFTDVTATHLVGDDELTTAVAFIDYDRDGDLDLIRGRLGDLQAKRSDFPLLAFANDGAGRFIAAPGIIRPLPEPMHSTSKLPISTATAGPTCSLQPRRSGPTVARPQMKMARRFPVGPFVSRWLSVSRSASTEPGSGDRCGLPRRTWSGPRGSGR
jgi:hypothetical protein